MEFWLDTVDLATIKRAEELGVLDGVTTNPSILAHPTLSAEQILEDVLHAFSGPITVQVTCSQADEMVAQGKSLFEFSPRVIVKIPAIEAGYRAIHRLNHIGIPTMATVIFEPRQAYLAAKAGASYLAPYFSHLGEQALAICDSIQSILRENHLSAKMLVASLKNISDLEKCMERGFAATTIKKELFEACMTTPPKTLEHLQRFEAAWQQAAPSQLV